MHIHWTLFVPALLLLFYPLDLWLTCHVRLRDFEYLSNGRRRGKHPWWRQSWAWMDPLRAFAGALALRHAWSFDGSLWHHLPFVAVLVMLILALGVQMHTRREEVLFAPVGFCAGLLFAVLPPQIAVLVLALAVTSLMAFRGWWAYFVAGSLGAGLLGLVILRSDLWTLAAVVLLVEPFIVSWIIRRELLVPVR